MDCVELLARDYVVCVYFLCGYVYDFSININSWTIIIIIRLLYSCIININHKQLINIFTTGILHKYNI